MAQLSWRKEFASAFPLTHVMQPFHPHAPRLRGMNEKQVSDLICSGYQILPDDCSAIVAVGRYGAAVCVPSRIEVTGEHGNWTVTSDLVEVPTLDQPAPIAGLFLGSRYLKISCGHQIFYDASEFGIILESPANSISEAFRVWKGLQLQAYTGESRESSRRQFNTNVIVEPFRPFTLEKGTIIAVVYLVPRSLSIEEVL